jgi:hypothetical protein
VSSELCLLSEANNKTEGKKMKINIKNKEKIEAILDEVQKNKSARTLGYLWVVELAEKAEKHLDDYDVPKKIRKNCVLDYFEHVNCNAYKYSYESTSISLQRGSSDWFLTICYRNSTWPNSTSKPDTTFFATEEVENFIKNKAVYEFQTGIN